MLSTYRDNDRYTPRYRLRRTPKHMDLIFLVIYMVAIEIYLLFAKVMILVELNDKYTYVKNIICHIFYFLYFLAYQFLW